MYKAVRLNITIHRYPRKFKKSLGFIPSSASSIGAAVGATFAGVPGAVIGGIIGSITGSSSSNETKVDISNET